MDTRKELEAAILRIVKKRPKRIAVSRKISIKAVAEEAGVSNATIHNTYPDIAVKIRGLCEKNFRLERDDARRDAKQNREELAALRETIRLLKQDISVLVSKNAVLTLVNSELETVINSDNVVSIQSGNRL